MPDEERGDPAALVVDSVQTIYSSRFPSAPGSISQVREAAQMGFTRCILPARNVPEDVDGIRLVGVNTLEEALERLESE